MAVTPTTSIPLGFKAPPFILPDVVSGKNIDLENISAEKGRVIMFICNHCPYVVHVREEIVRIAREYQPKGIGFVAISSNDIQKYPEDAPGPMKELAEEMEFPFPYLFDESQEVARAYDAACTPDFSVFDKNRNCIYRGRMDSSTPGNNVPVTGEDLRGVLEDLLNEREIIKDQRPSMGCNIKWKSS